MLFVERLYFLIATRQRLVGCKQSGMERGARGEGVLMLFLRFFISRQVRLQIEDREDKAKV